MIRELRRQPGLHWRSTWPLRGRPNRRRNTLRFSSEAVLRGRGPTCCDWSAVTDIAPVTNVPMLLIVPRPLGSLTCCERRFPGPVVPASGGCHTVDLLGTPGARRIWINRSSLFQHRLHNAPCFLDVVFAGKERAIARHSGSENTLVCIHLIGGWEVAGNHFSILKSEAFGVRTQRHDAHGNRHFGTKPQPEMAFFQSTLGHPRRGLVQRSNNFRTGDRQILASTNVERHTLPSPRIDFQLERGECFGL